MLSGSNYHWLRVGVIVMRGDGLMSVLVVITGTSTLLFLLAAASTSHFLTALTVGEEFNLLDTMKNWKNRAE